MISLSRGAPPKKLRSKSYAETTNLSASYRRGGATCDSRSCLLTLLPSHSPRLHEPQAPDSIEVQDEANQG